jgi:cytochrome c peroxidase
MSTNTRLRAGGMAVGLAAVVAACGPSDGASWDWGLPEGYPQPVVPADNPMNEAKVELGRRLFYDTALSGNQTQSCASCHDQARAFTDALPRSFGSTGEMHPRNAMSLTNVAYLPRLTWANPVLDSLEEQALVPMFGEHPVELGMAGQEEVLLRRLADASMYPELFADAFPTDADPISVGNVVRALAAFQRTLISHRSPYDRYVYEGDTEALSESARRGAELFFSERLECFHCHGGFNFTDSVRHDGSVDDAVPFHNTGLYNVDGRGSYPADNIGLMEITGDRRDMGRFRAPTLRNIELTAPYFHDGSAATLDEVIDHYVAGGRTIEEDPNAGIGAESPLKSIFVRGFVLSAEERADLIAFLRSLTDWELTRDPRFENPFE